MKCFIFSGNQSEYCGICGTSVTGDLVSHLRRSGVTTLYSDTDSVPQGVEVCSFHSVQAELGSGWLAAYSGSITRQSPVELRNLTNASAADTGISLACSAKPWEHTTILTDGFGYVEKAERNPSPENLETNLCFSGLAWVASGSFDPCKPAEGKGRTAAFLLPGYWKCPDNRENFLLTVHDILSHRVLPWPHCLIPANGVFLESNIPDSTEVKGTLWVGSNCFIGDNCVLENCVILHDSATGAHSNLRNCLVSSATEVPPGTELYDKYLSFFTGDDHGHEY
jgi:hypothetical protein